MSYRSVMGVANENYAKIAVTEGAGAEGAGIELDHGQVGPLTCGRYGRPSPLPHLVL